jgi:hypothetical protein
MTAPVYDQDSVRLRHDDGTEVTANWLVLVNTDAKVGAGWICRSRYLIQETGGKSTDDFTPELRYSYNGAAYALLTTSSSYIKLVASGTVSDGTATTQQLGAGTFDGGSFDSNGTVALESFTKGQEKEYEWCHQIVSADVKPGDTIALRVYHSGGVGLNAYTNTLTMTIRRKGHIVHTGQ